MPKPSIFFTRIRLVIGLLALTTGPWQIVPAAEKIIPPPVPEGLRGKPELLDRTGWRSLPHGPSPPTHVTVNNRSYLTLPLEFDRTAGAGINWERPVDLDLRDATEIVMDVYAIDLDNVRRFNLYLKSGGGWYVASFWPAGERRWSRIRLAKTDFAIEDAPNGWMKIEAIRIRAWVKNRAAAQLLVANPGFSIRPSSVVVVRFESDLKKDGAATLPFIRRTDETARLLAEAGIAVNLVSDGDLSGWFLRNRKVAILAGALEMPQRAEEVLCEFLRNGGRIVSFGTLTPKLAGQMGIALAGTRTERYAGEFYTLRFPATVPPGMEREVTQPVRSVVRASSIRNRSWTAAWWYDEAGLRTDAAALIMSGSGAYLTHGLTPDRRRSKRSLVAGLTARFSDEAAREMCRERLVLVAGIFGEPDLDTLVGKLRGHPDATPDVERLVAQARVDYAAAGASLAAGRFDDALSNAARAEGGLLRAYAALQPSRAGERRYLWCHHPRGIHGMGWNEIARTVASSGFTGIFANFAWGVAAAYPSEILPFRNGLDGKTNYLTLAARACAAQNLELHVWMFTFHAPEWATPKAFFERLKSEGRLMIGPDGRHRDWLCPGDVRNRELLKKIALEAVAGKGVTGVHIDYVRYPADDLCCCPRCRTNFERAIGRRVAGWPLDVKMGAPLHDAWVRFRADGITEFVRELRGSLRARPEIKLSAAVYADPVAALELGQDWRKWVTEGLVDFVCPMNYTQSQTQFERHLETQAAIPQGTGRIFPGIGAVSASSQLNPVEVIRQITALRKAGFDGFSIFQLEECTIGELLPLLGRKMTAR